MLTVIKLLLDFVGMLSKYAHDNQLIEAGEYKAIARANEEALNNINAARIARSSPVLPDDEDPDNRD